MYGAKTYGDLCNARQTLGLRAPLPIDLTRSATNLRAAGVSADYASALSAYAASVLVRKLKYSTRGHAPSHHFTRSNNRVQVDHIFTNEASIAFSYDFFETGLGDGPGTWASCRWRHLGRASEPGSAPGGTAEASSDKGRRPLFRSVAEPSTPSSPILPTTT